MNDILKFCLALTVMITSVVVLVFFLTNDLDKTRELRHKENIKRTADYHEMAIEYPEIAKALDCYKDQYISEHEIKIFKEIIRRKNRWEKTIQLQELLL